MIACFRAVMPLELRLVQSMRMKMMMKMACRGSLIIRKKQVMSLMKEETWKRGITLI